jgi:hypothetical protein
VTTYNYFESFLSLKEEFNYTAYSIFEDDSIGSSVYNAEIVAKESWNLSAWLKCHMIHSMIRKNFLPFS